MKPTFRRALPVASVTGPATLLTISFLASAVAHGASATWNGTVDATWANAANWSAAPAPTTGEVATFNNAGNGKTTLDLGAGVTVGSIVFDAAAASYTLGSGAAGSQSLALDTAGSITSNTAVGQSIAANLNLPIVANSTVTLTNTGTGLLSVSGAINAVPDAGSSVMNVAGSGNTTVTGAITETGAGGSALLKTGTGTLTLANGSAFSGAGAIGNNPAAGYPVVVREGTLLLTGGTHTTNGETVIGGVVTNGGAGQNAKIQVDAGTLAVDNWLSIGRGNGIGGVSTDLELRNAAIVTAANLSAGFNGGSALNLPKGSITQTGSSSITVAGTVNLAESAGANFIHNLSNTSTFSGGGTTNIATGAGSTLVLTLSDATSFSLTNAVNIATAATSRGTLNINGTSTFKQTANAGETRLGGGAGSLGVINVNGGTATFERDLLVGYNGTATGRLILNSGTINMATATERWLKIGNGDTAAGELTVNGGTLNLNANADIRFSTAASGVGTNVANLNGGAITGGTSSILDLKYSSGAGANNTFNLNGGILSLAQVNTTNDTATATFNFNGGTLRSTASTADWFFLGGPLQHTYIKTPGAIIDTNGFDVRIAEPLLADAGGSGGLTKNGAGTLTLAGANTFTGPIALNQGTLALGGTYPGNALTVAAGTGLTVAEPAVALGTLTVGNVNFGAGATLALETAAGNVSEKIVTGGLTHAALGINLYASGTTTPAVPGTYTLFQYSGPLVGGTAGLSVLNQRLGYTYNFADTGSAITLQVISLDADGDGMTDSYETANGLNPNEDGTIGETTPGAKNGPNGALGNIDGDFSTNYEEFLAGTAANNAASDANNVDNDGLPDPYEVTNFGNITGQTGASDFDGDFDSNLLEYTKGTNPALASSFTDADSDGLVDSWEIRYFTNITAKDGSVDSDGDLYTDKEEYRYGSDPINSSFSPGFAKATHRWSFTGNLNDSIGTSNATIENGTTNGTNVVTQNADSVKLAGGTRATSQWVKLGSNLLPNQNTPVTIELWATQDAVQNYSRVFDFHSGQAENLYMSWSMGTTASSDRVQWLDVANMTADNTNNYALANKYHIVMTIQPSTTAVGSSLVKWYSAFADGLTDLGAPKGSFTIATSVGLLSDTINSLGYSAYGGDNTASATYDEVRIWDGALPVWALHDLHKQGPDSNTQADTDNDKLPDAFEQYYFGDLTKGPNDDTDGDLSSNRDELLAGSDPFQASSSPNDSDSDGLPDAWELGYFGNLAQDGSGDPDGDLAFNNEELAANSNPSLYTSFPDADQDGMSDGWELINLPNPAADSGNGDDDGDGFNSLAEFTAKTDPANPLSPGVPDGDVDNDGLPDRWEIAQFTSIVSQTGATDSDGDGASNLLEYQATSIPTDSSKTPTDINGDGVTDQKVFLSMETTGTGVLDKDSQATPFTKRLSVLPAVSTIPTVDPNLDLDTVAGTLAIKSNAADINNQVTVAQLEALGLPLSSLGFTGANDFRIRAHYVNLPVMDGYDQIGAYVGTSSRLMTRAAKFGPNNQALGVNTNGAADSAAVFGATGSAGLAATDLTVIIERVAGVWTMSCNGIVCTAGAQPAFLDGLSTLEVGVFALHQTTQKTATLESFTAVSFGTSSSTPADADTDGMSDAWEITHFGNTSRDGTGDFDNDGASDFAESAFNGNPSNGASKGSPAVGMADSNANGQKDLTMVIAVRTGAVFSAGANGSQIATVSGVSYTVRGSLNLAAFNGAVSHVSTAGSSDPAYELHTFRLDSSEGLAGKGFLQAAAIKAP